MHPMRKILIGIAYAALLVLTSACTDTRDLNVTPAAHVTEAAEAAPTHMTNSYATWACGATRQTPLHILEHSHVVTFNPTYLLAECQSQDGVFRCFWDAILWWNGATSIAGGPDGARCVILPS